ncbi:MAG: flagellar basal body P-ring formation chaperone FlgA [Parvularculaceae bacterium]
MPRPFRTIRSENASGRPFYAPGFLAYATILMWLLLTVLSPVRAQESLPPRAPADVVAEIEAALRAQGLGPNAEIIFDDPQAPIRAAATSAVLTVEQTSRNPVTGRFIVRLRAGDGGPLFALAGTARERVAFPVPVREFERGETLREDDIDFVESAEVRPNAYIRDADELIGKETRRPLRKGAPVRPSDVVAPVLVKRGELVTMTYSVEGLRLTHMGVALDSGAKGEVIDIRNVRSERVLKAAVSGRGAAVVASPRTLAADGEG